MKKFIRLISLLMVVLMCFSCGGNTLVYAEEINIQTEELTTTTRNLTEINETETFYVTEIEDILAGEEWFVGESGEIYEFDSLAGEEQPENNSQYMPFNLDDPNETSDLNIELPYLTPFYGSRSNLATLLGVNWTAESGLKFMPQGGCSDGEYIYYAFNVYYSSPRKTECQKILCAKLSPNGGIEGTPHITTFSYLDHANSLTYNSKTDQVIVANCSADILDENGVSRATDEHYLLTVLNAAYLRGESRETSEASYRYIPCMASAITYDEYEDQYIVGLTGKKYSYAILNSDFNLEKVIGYQPVGTPEPEYTAWTRNDICCDYGNIYSMVMCTTEHKDAYGNVQYRTYENILMVFDKKAIDNPGDTDSITAKEINLLEPTSYFEGESVFFHDDRLLLGISHYDYQSSRNSNYGYVDITEHTFRVEYEPNYNMSNNVTGADSTRKSSLVIHCAATRLMPNTFANTGYKFLGWAAYYVDGNLWYCTKADGTRGWVSSLSEGDSLYLYSDKQKIAQTVPKNKTVVMVAQWAQTDNFAVRFLSNDKNNLTLTQECVHSSVNILTSCTFTDEHKTSYGYNSATNDNAIFVGWNAYWVEGDKWYYQSPDGNSRDWYKQGQQPTGYKKCVYTNQARVSKTVPKGHTVEMHALWNEFKIYYFAGAMEIPFNNILLPTVKPLDSDSTVNLSVFPRETNTTEVKGWYLYHVENDKWYYQNANASIKNWYTFNEQPSGYSKHLYTGTSIGNMASAGDSIVLCWNDGTSANYDFVN